jgi:dephospho-CoA kinase
MTSSRSKRADDVIVPSFGVIGPMRCGKSLFADSLSNELRATFHIRGVPTLSFSTKVVDIAVDLFEMPPGGKDRKLLQDIGHLFKLVRINVWSDYIVRKVKTEKLEPFIVDGIRYLEDIAVLSKNFPNFVIVKIDADEKKRLEAFKDKHGRFPTDEELNHPTEINIPFLPHHIKFYNDYIRESLDENIKLLVKGVKDGSLLKLLRKAAA